MSASVHCGSRRVQLVIDDVVGAPDSVVFAPGGITMGGCGSTLNVFEISPTVPKLSVARTVRVWSRLGAVGGNGSVILNGAQPLTGTAFANWPPSTLYCTSTTGACGLVADPMNTK